MSLFQRLMGEKDDNVSENCEKCDVELTAGGIVKCDGVCNKRFHSKCVKMSTSVVKAWEENDNLFFICDECNGDSIKAINTKLTKIFSMFSIYDEQAKRNEANLNEMKQLVCDLKQCVEIGNKDVRQKIENVNINNTAEPVSYAQKVKAANNNAVVIVKPKKSEQNSNETKIEIKKKIDTANFKIDRVRNMPAGAIAVECANRNVSEVLKTVAVEKMGDGYVVEIPKLKYPCIKLIDMTDKYSEEELVMKLKAQNSELIGDSEMKVLNIINRGKKWFSAIIEVDPEGFEKCMLAGKLNIGWERCRVFENLNVNMCYKCCGFNHKAKTCKNKRICKKCAGEHDVTECKSDIIKCVNCVQAVKKLKIRLDVNHKADDPNCRVHNRKKFEERRKIEYEQ